MYWTEAKTQNTMRIFVLLFIMFVSTAHSRLQPSKFFLQANGEIRATITTAICTFGQELGKQATDFKKLCSKLHDLGKQLPKPAPPLQGLSDDLGKQLPKPAPSLQGLSDAVDDLDKKVAKALDDVCNIPAKFLSDASKRIMKICQNALQTTTSDMSTPSTVASDMTTLSTVMSTLTTLSTTTLAPTTQSTSTVAPTTQSTSTLAPSTSTVAPTTQSTSTPAPTTSTPAPTTLKTSTQVPTTAKSKSKHLCGKDAIEKCDETCKQRSNFDLNLGGLCKESRRTRTCDCKKVTHCDSYKNATCEKQCERYKGEICRIPEAGFTCVCKFMSGSTTYYRVPK